MTLTGKQEPFIEQLDWEYPSFIFPAQIIRKSVSISGYDECYTVPAVGTYIFSVIWWRSLPQKLYLNYFMDLSYNNLTRTVPEFFADLPLLMVL